MWRNEKVYNALFFAVSKHENQKMKHPEGMPYSAHIMGVALTAIKYATTEVNKFDMELICCVALLHDVIEDCGVGFNELRALFGDAVANGVMALSKNDNLKKEEKMLDSLRRIKMQPKEVAIVKMADRLFNMRDNVPSWSKDKLLEYKKEAQLVCDELGFDCKTLKNDLQAYINKY